MSWGGQSSSHFSLKCSRTSLQKYWLTVKPIGRYSWCTTHLVSNNIILFSLEHNILSLFGLGDELTVTLGVLTFSFWAVLEYP
jgi:hypothetical protein